MSRIQAYICDHCGAITNDCVGVLPIADLYEKLDSYPIVYDPTKADVHICVTCYRVNVTDRAEKEVRRAENERGYLLKIRELSFIVREKSISNWKAKKYLTK